MLDTLCYFQNEQLNQLPPHASILSDLFEMWGDVVFISMICVQTKTFVVSVVAQNAIMFVYGILFGGLHQESSQKTRRKRWCKTLYHSYIALFQADISYGFYHATHLRGVESNINVTE